MNFEKARFNMIEQQIRPWDVLDARILEQLANIKREAFVPPHLQSLAFADTELPIGHGQTMLTPRLEARLLQAAAVKPNDNVLEIGTGTGFMAALLAYTAANVFTYETIAELAQTAKQNLNRALFDNVQVMTGCGFAHAQDESHTHSKQGWNLIVLSGSAPSIEALPQQLIDSLTVGGRIIGIFGQESHSPMMNASRITKKADNQLVIEHLFETNAAPLTGLSTAAFTF